MHTVDCVGGQTEAFVVIAGWCWGCAWLSVDCSGWLSGGCMVTVNLIVTGSHWWSWVGSGVVGGFTGSTTGYWTDHCHRFIAYCDQI